MPLLLCHTLTYTELEIVISWYKTCQLLFFILFFFILCTALFYSCVWCCYCLQERLDCLVAVPLDMETEQWPRTCTLEKAGALTPMASHQSLGQGTLPFMNYHNSDYSMCICSAPIYLVNYIVTNKFQLLEHPPFKFLKYCYLCGRINHTHKLILLCYIFVVFVRRVTTIVTVSSWLVTAHSRRSGWRNRRYY